VTTPSELKKTPLNKWHRANGATFEDSAGWEMPLHYAAGVTREHLATRKFGALFDLSHMGCFRIKGKNRVEFLQRVLSNNCDALQPWQAQYTLIPNKDGGVIDDGYLYRFGQDDYLLAVNAENRKNAWNHLRRHAKDFEGVSLKDHTEKVALIAFQGPLSGRILETLIEDGALPEPFRNSLSEVTLCRAKALLARTGFTGEPLGFELFVAPDKAEEVWRTLYEAGKDQGVMAAGLATRDSLRLEAGYPLFGHELGVDAQGRPCPAFAVGMTASAVSFSDRKGDFIGREPLAAQAQQVELLRTGQGEPSQILPRRIRPLALLDEGVIRAGDEVFIGHKQVGVVTSAAVTPYWIFAGGGATMDITDQTGSRTVALASLDATLRADREVEIAVDDRRLHGQIVRWHGRSEAPPYFRPIPVGRKEPEPEAALVTGIGKAELVLKKSIENHQWRQQRCVNLIPSEMTQSPLVRLLQVSDPVGRYAEHKELLAAFGQDVFYYQGTELIAWVEQRLIEELEEYLGCPLVEVRTISGQMANQTVFSAFVDYKNRVDRRREAQRISLALNNHIGRGGHLSSQPMGALRDYIAKDPVTERYAVINFPVCRDNPYRLDVVETAKILERTDPEIIIFGKSMVLHPEPVAEIKRGVEHKKNRPIIMYDMAHVLGLIGPHFQQPFAEGADLVTGSTHKTYFGTQRGIIGGNFVPNTPHMALWKAIRRRAFPGMVSNHHLGTLLGLLLAAIEMNTYKHEYQRQVVANAKALARALADEGLNVEGDPDVDYTETHQVMVNVGYARGCEVAQTLEKNNIILNYQALPSDESFTSSSGLRLGVQEMTRFGMTETDFEAFASLFADAVNGGDVADQIAEFRAGFQTMHYCFEGDALEPLKQQLLKTF